MDHLQYDHTRSVRVAASKEAASEVQETKRAVGVAADIRRNILLCFAPTGFDVQVVVDSAHSQSTHCHHFMHVCHHSCVSKVQARLKRAR